jgi:hypothetical protein
MLLEQVLMELLQLQGLLPQVLSDDILTINFSGEIKIIISSLKWLLIGI